MVFSLWSHYTSCILMNFKYCCNKCMKKFFGYSKYYSVTEMLLALGLSSFDTVIHNYRKSFLYVWSKHSNDLVKLLRCVSPSAFYDFYCVLLYFFAYSVCLYVCLCAFVYGLCFLVQIKWWLLLLMLTRILTIGRIARIIFHWGKFNVTPCSQSGPSYQRILLSWSQGFDLGFLVSV